MALCLSLRAREEDCRPRGSHDREKPSPILGTHECLPLNVEGVETSLKTVQRWLNSKQAELGWDRVDMVEG